MLLDWVDRMELCSSEKSCHVFVSLLTTFDTNPKKYVHLYAYNVYLHYEYLDGRIKSPERYITSMVSCLEIGHNAL